MRTLCVSQTLRLVFSSNVLILSHFVIFCISVLKLPIDSKFDISDLFHVVIFLNYLCIYGASHCVIAYAWCGRHTFYADVFPRVVVVTQNFADPFFLFGFSVSRFYCKCQIQLNLVAWILLFECQTTNKASGVKY